MSVAIRMMSCDVLQLFLGFFVCLRSVSAWLCVCMFYKLYNYDYFLLVLLVIQKVVNWSSSIGKTKAVSGHGYLGCLLHSRECHTSVKSTHCIFNKTCVLGNKKCVFSYTIEEESE